MSPRERISIMYQRALVRTWNFLLVYKRVRSIPSIFPIACHVPKELNVGYPTKWCFNNFKDFISAGSFFVPCPHPIHPAPVMTIGSVYRCPVKRCTSCKPFPVCVGTAHLLWSNDAAYISTDKIISFVEHWLRSGCPAQVSLPGQFFMASFSWRAQNLFIFCRQNVFIKSRKRIKFRVQCNHKRTAFYDLENKNVHESQKLLHFQMIIQK